MLTEQVMCRFLRGFCLDVFQVRCVLMWACFIGLEHETIRNWMWKKPKTPTVISQKMWFQLSNTGKPPWKTRRTTSGRFDYDGVVWPDRLLVPWCGAPGPEYISTKTNDFLGSISTKVLFLVDSIQVGSTMGFWIFFSKHFCLNFLTVWMIFGIWDSVSKVTVNSCEERLKRPIRLCWQDLNDMPGLVAPWPWHQIPFNETVWFTWDVNWLHFDVISDGFCLSQKTCSMTWSAIQETKWFASLRSSIGRCEDLTTNHIIDGLPGQHRKLNFWQLI